MTLPPNAHLSNLRRRAVTGDMDDVSTYIQALRRRGVSFPYSPPETKVHRDPSRPLKALALAEDRTRGSPSSCHYVEGCHHVEGVVTYRWSSAHSFRPTVARLADEGGFLMPEQAARFIRLAMPTTSRRRSILRRKT